ncbi:MAG: hypothetical protein IPM39_18040 [Chloroflexi bacterium]|nr:hypothetical protein [Chloroflexota bacterium]
MSDDMENYDDFPEKEPMSDFEPLPEKEEPTNLFGTDVTSDDKLWALLAYVLSPLVPIIIMVMEDKKGRPFLRAHNGQALAWGLLTVVVGMFTSFLCGIPAFLMWLLGCYWGWQAYQGQMVTIPVITGFVKNQGWA